MSGVEADVPRSAPDAISMLGLTYGDPFNRLTWSGITFHLFNALQRAGSRVDAIDVSSAGMNRLSQVVTFSPNRRRWMQRYMAGATPLAPTLTWVQTWLTVKRAAQAAAAADVLLQVGPSFDSSEIRGPRVYASYHDANTAVFIRRPDVLLNPDSGAVRATLKSERRVFDHMDIIFTMSEWLRRSFIEDFDQEPSKVKAVGAGANFDELPPPVERRWDPARILFVGKGDFTRKGGPVLLRAFERVRARHPTAELWMVGPPADPAPPPGVQYFGRISRATEAGRARFREIMETATCFALPSLFEPFGIAFLEAMAYGLPCVATDSCAMPEIVEDGVTGLLASPGDADALGECLLEIVAAPDTASAMGAAGRRRMVERFTWDSVARRMLDAYSGRLDGSAPVPSPEAASRRA